MADPFNLQRFVSAQSGDYQGGDYQTALAELRAGQKRSHWIWYVFPQIAGLGFSEMNRRYAIGSLAEAEAYLAHPVLGEHLRECVDAVNALDGRTAGQVFGPDDVKVRSSLTLFAEAAPTEQRFRAALDKYFDGEPDPATLEKLGTQTHFAERG